MNDLEKNLVSGDDQIKKRNDRLVHGLVASFICCISAGAGVAIFFGQRATELAIFKTQFDGTIQQLQSTIQIGLSQKYAASRLLNKLFTYGAESGCGTTYGQSPPFFTLPGFQHFSDEIKTLGGSLRGIQWNPLVNNNTRTEWELWAKKNIAVQTVGLPPSVFNTINATGEQKYPLIIQSILLYPYVPSSHKPL